MTDLLIRLIRSITIFSFPIELYLQFVQCDKYLINCTVSFTINLNHKLIGWQLVFRYFCIEEYSRYIYSINTQGKESLTANDYLFVHSDIVFEEFQ